MSEGEEVSTSEKLDECCGWTSASKEEGALTGSWRFGELPDHEGPGQL